MHPLDMPNRGNVTNGQRAVYLGQFADKRVGHLGLGGKADMVPYAGGLVISLPPEGVQGCIADQAGNQPV